MTMKSNDPKMIAYLPVMYCVNCTGGEAEETLMLMLVLVRWRWWVMSGFGFGLHIFACVTVTGSFFALFFFLSSRRARRHLCGFSSASLSSESEYQTKECQPYFSPSISLSLSGKGGLISSLGAWRGEDRRRRWPPSRLDILARFSRKLECRVSVSVSQIIIISR